MYKVEHICCNYREYKYNKIALIWVTTHKNYVVIKSPGRPYGQTAPGSCLEPALPTVRCVRHPTAGT